MLKRIDASWMQRTSFRRLWIAEPTAFSAAFLMVLWSTLRKKLYSQLRAKKGTPARASVIAALG
jgi:hypothetical protein